MQNFDGVAVEDVPCVSALRKNRDVSILRADNGCIDLPVLRL